jgi:hypothetical protein
LLLLLLLLFSLLLSYTLGESSRFRQCVLGLQTLQHGCTDTRI